MTETARYRTAINAPIDVGSPTRFGAAARFSRRAVLRALRHYDEHQQRRHTVALETVGEAVSSLRAAVGAIDGAVQGLSEKHKEVQGQFDGLRMRTDVASRGADVLGHDVSAQRDRLDDLSAFLQARHQDVMRHIASLLTGLDDAGTALDGLNTLFGALEGRVHENEGRLKRLVAELHEPPYTSDADALVRPGADGRPQLGYTSPADADGSAGFGYPDFEDLFRGTEEYIMQRQQVYLGLLRDHAPVFDFGCGRGELLRVLADAGIAARGVDTDETMLARCRRHGLDVEAGDGIKVLADGQPGTFGAVVSLQVVEHLPPESLPDFFRSARRALRPGGILACETVNPHSPAALRTFWLDVTHRHPLYPEALLLCARAAGFPEAHILFPYGSGELGADLANAGEYTLVARTTVSS